MEIEPQVLIPAANDIATDQLWISAMRRCLPRFTIRSLMHGMAVVAIVSWVAGGLIRHGAAWFTQPPFYMLALYPLLFAALMTLAVTVIQIRLERNQPRKPRI
jgi:multisubunit Na+/H+ antiporter MnhE subunit